MKKYLFVPFFLMFCFACNSKEEAYTFDKFKEDYEEYFNILEIPIGTFFWDEFNDIEEQYNLTKNESILLGEWKNVTFVVGPTYNSYNFFPNHLFVLRFKLDNFQIIDEKEMYFYKAFGTWEIRDNIVKITIYALTIEDDTRDHPNNKDVFIVEHPYTVDFININDIGEEGYTKRPINDTILSKELRKMVKIKEPNKSNNLYVRRLYMIAFMTNSGQPEKDYGNFRYVREMAQANHSGLEIATNPELIKKYIPDWMY